ncbi:MAG TPA: hypothetical protein DHU55_19975 [Blastocatellia bacterium]|jgi:hypothetical protein|nr:hypothetical protein [Blastocatellia bacterium]HAF23211.1 hypothetical protein [Blastocatellia bacterium]HCX32021.1 hypothetical protein [Blastocatellia bacterium]
MSEKPISSSREARRKTVGDAGEAGDILTSGKYPPGSWQWKLEAKADYSLAANTRLASLVGQRLSVGGTKQKGVTVSGNSVNNSFQRLRDTMV